LAQRRRPWVTPRLFAPAEYVSWCGQVQEFVPLPERDGSCGLVADLVVKEQVHLGPWRQGGKLFQGLGQVVKLLLYEP